MSDVTPNRLAVAVESGRWRDALDTPSLVVDLSSLRDNVARVAAQAGSRGVALRPHFKTHKCTEIAEMQARHGAVGQTCATLGEAEVLAEGGFTDVFVAYPVWPLGPKRRRLLDLHDRIELTVGVDSVEQAQALGAINGAVRPLQVLIEVDTGGQRTGVSPAAAGAVAAAAARCGLRVRGVFTHGGHSYGLGEAAHRAARDEVDGLAAAVESLQAHRLPAPVVSAGSTPTAMLSATDPVTEERPGTYVFGDRQQVAIGSCTSSEVALLVAATVVSRAVPGQVVIDAGTKSLGRENQPWLSGFGQLPCWPAVELERLYDHHGVGLLPTGRPGPDVGSLVAVMPNHVCPVVNLARELVVVDGDNEVARWPVAARAAV
jgi:D-serine deaminase-like pyridoxal phosphate-dependent protein